MTTGPVLMTGELRKLRAMAADGYTKAAAARELNRPHQTICAWAKKHNIPFVPRSARPPTLFCSKGHMLSEDNVYLSGKRRRCRSCLLIYEKERYTRQRVVFAPTKMGRRIEGELNRLRCAVNWIIKNSTDQAAIDAAKAAIIWSGNANLRTLRQTSN